MQDLIIATGMLGLVALLAKSINWLQAQTEVHDEDVDDQGN